MTVRERMALRLAAETFRYPAVRESRAHDELGMSAPRFWQVVNALLDRPDAEAEMPAEVHRLQRRRALLKSARRKRIAS